MNCDRCEKELGHYDNILQKILHGICLECGYQANWEGLEHNERVRCLNLLKYARMTPEQRQAFDRKLGS